MARTERTEKTGRELQEFVNPIKEGIKTVKAYADIRVKFASVGKASIMDDEIKQEFAKMRNALDEFEKAVLNG